MVQGGDRERHRVREITTLAVQGDGLRCRPFREVPDQVDVVRRYDAVEYLLAEAVGPWPLDGVAAAGAVLARYAQDPVLAGAAEHLVGGGVVDGHVVRAPAFATRL